MEPRTDAAPPRRIRLSRRLGWRKPTGAVVVARPSRWGNPFPIGPELTRVDAMRRFEAALLTGSLRVTVADVRRDLAGRDLACWCPLDAPCHAGVLLRVANASPEPVADRGPDAAAEGPARAPPRRPARPPPVRP